MGVDPALQEPVPPEEPTPAEVQAEGFDFVKGEIEVIGAMGMAGKEIEGAAGDEVSVGGILEGVNGGEMGDGKPKAAAGLEDAVDFAQGGDEVDVLEDGFAEDFAEGGVGKGPGAVVNIVDEVDAGERGGVEVEVSGADVVAATEVKFGEGDRKAEG